ncbi:hypothetical protein LTS15_006167 [Exophiala xenobiotica]|nr:hypothetical protein LTS15_006167 [Exophiala xenobiotica]
MSTFNGIVREFPNIRIDYFRTHPDRPPPEAYFLSHVHSDHLLGLESVKMPFVYCSPTTKQILLKLEKYPSRINFAKGILESRRLHYRRLHKILRTLPLNTATRLELSPKCSINVTLIDANHCPGAVMFLVEGDGKAILYTGDVRAEPWWVNSIVQDPVLLPYACGLKSLDCIYLDTTFASHEEPYREFPAKAEGLKELLEKVSQCSPDTIFYFRAWTLGYENVWIALSNFLKSRIHVDQYQLRILRPAEEHGASGYSEGASLTGCAVGNQQLAGCLSTDPNVKIHSCEPGLPCHADLSQRHNVKWITPIISRLKDGTEILEIGAGGGGGDLFQLPELSLADSASLQQLGELCAGFTEDEKVKSRIKEEVERAKRSRNFHIQVQGLSLPDPNDNPTMPLKDFVMKLARSDRWFDSSVMVKDQIPFRSKQDTIHFPYSRHSSYHELRHLVSIFRPKDLCACTVDPESWSPEVSMEALFGDLCSGEEFFFDHAVREEMKLRESIGVSNGRKGKRNGDEDENTQETETQEEVDPEDVFETAQAQVEGGVCDSAKCPGIEQSSIESKLNTMNDRHINDLEKIRAAFLRINRGKNYIDLEDEMVGSLAFSDFSSQIEIDSELSGQLEQEALQKVLSTSHGKRRGEEDIILRGGDAIICDGVREDADSRRFARMEAYMAARRCLLGNDSSAWDDLSLRSVGQKGHEEGEMEL